MLGWLGKAKFPHFKRKKRISDLDSAWKMTTILKKETRLKGFLRFYIK